MRNNKVIHEHMDLAQQGFDVVDIPGLIKFFIEEILMSGGIKKSYDEANGKYPPLVSFESQAKKKELLPFCWTSNHESFREKDMYLKFVLLDDFYLYLSLHEDNQGKKK